MVNDFAFCALALPAMPRSPAAPSIFTNDRRAVMQTSPPNTIQLSGRTDHRQQVQAFPISRLHFQRHCRCANRSPTSLESAITIACRNQDLRRAKNNKSFNDGCGYTDSHRAARGLPECGMGWRGSGHFQAAWH